MTSHMEQFVKTIARLRGPDGCPWDREQTHESLIRYLLEETYEVLESIHENNPAKLKEELGDLLLQIVLQAQIASETGSFSIEDVAEAINTKMIRRHPHVFGNGTASSADEVLSQWEELKKQETAELQEAGSNNGKSPFDSIPKAMPALLRSLKISEKAVHNGFEWKNFDELWQKMESEIAELKEALASEDSPKKRAEIEMELGDVLFTLVNIARWNKLNPEECLIRSTEKFCTRYQIMDNLSGHNLAKLSKEELLELWLEAKNKAQAARS